MPQKGQITSKSHPGLVVQVKSKNGNYLGTVDRTIEEPPFNTCILVTLPCGHIERFFIPGLSDREYLRRTKYLKKKFNHERADNTKA